MEKQLWLDFYFGPKPIDLMHATVITRWDYDRNKLEARWPAFGLTSWFYNWQEALPYVFYPGLNDHVRMRVRA